MNTMMKSLRRAKKRTQASRVRRAGAREPPTGTASLMVKPPKTQVTSRLRRNQVRRRVKKRRQAAEDRELVVEDAEGKEELRPLLVTRLPLEASVVALQRTQSQM